MQPLALLALLPPPQQPPPPVLQLPPGLLLLLMQRRHLSRFQSRGAVCQSLRVVVAVAVGR
jgi:hypothetical protein